MVLRYYSTTINQQRKVFMNIIGIDPDSDKSGVATYEDGQLVFLQMLDFYSLFKFCQVKTRQGYAIVIEDVTYHKAIYAKKSSKNPRVNAAIGKSVGQCQGMYKCLLNMLEHIGAEVFVFKPLQGTAKATKTNADLFNKITGWREKSNPDTRDAAMIVFANRHYLQKINKK